MNDLHLILASLRARKTNTILSVLLVAFGVMLAALVIFFGHHVERRLTADAHGIDMVIGAKGSPLQLVLSSVYQIDMPTGNIPEKEADQWAKHPSVKQAIPLALGDNWHGFRIVGTTHDYPANYDAAPADGRLWDKPFEAVAGVDVNLKTGDRFAGAHGLLSGGHDHADHQYTVVGRLARTGTVVDRLILTSTESVLELHGLESGHHHDDGGEHEHEAHKEHEEHEHEEHGEPEITALLLKLKTPLAQMNFPHQVNRESNLQAAHPATEMARLSGMLGVGAKTFTILAAILILIAAMNIFSGIAGSLDSRKKDLAVLRALGYSRGRIFRIVALEGGMLAAGGVLSGLAMGFAAFTLMAVTLAPLKASGATASWDSGITGLAVLTLLAGLAAAIIPATRAAGIDAADQLSKDN